MVTKQMSKVQKLTISAMVIALYVTVLYFTQSFSFGAYQIRIATSLYALSYLFPFLVLPLGLANFTANVLFGGLGPLDMVGGFVVGLTTAWLVALIRKQNWNRWLVALPILLIPALGASIWLSYLLEMPYQALALSLCIGQAIPAVCGVLLINALERIWVGKKTVQE
jgi:uncharacterized membrane protein